MSGDVSPCHISRCNSSARFVQRSHCITRMVGAGLRYQHFTVFGFRLFRCLMLLYPDLRSDNGFCGGIPYHILYGDLNFGLAEVAV